MSLSEFPKVLRVMSSKSGKLFTQWQSVTFRKTGISRIFSNFL
jgi:hypothetical protein